MSTTFLAWRAPSSRRWYPVGRLDSEAGSPAGGTAAHGSGADGAPAEAYWFSYTHGARQAARDAGFAPLASFPDFEARYVSAALFPLFANRLLPKSRPEYPSYFSWLNVSDAPNDALALLARSGGHRVTDEFELYPAPEPDARGELRLHCFVHGIRYFTGAAEWLGRVQAGDPLLLLHDFQNAHDPDAVMVRTPGTGPGDAALLGYLPRYVAPEVHTLRRALGAEGRTGELRALVERVNPPSAPLGLRLLCRVEAPWPAGYEPFADEAHRPIDTPREVVVGGLRPRKVPATAGQAAGVEGA